MVILLQNTNQSYSTIYSIKSNSIDISNLSSEISRIQTESLTQKIKKLKESIINLEMAERKVLIKYFPKNFNHEIIVKRGRGKDKLMMVRNMLPMSLRCSTCQNYLYIGTKFNMRMQICNEQTYLGIKVFRFYFKCTTCYAEITFKTDPKNHDYVVETGGTRNYEAIKDAQHAEKYLQKLKKDEKDGDSMKYLESRTYDSKRQMELMEALEDIKNSNKRQAVIDPEDLLKNLIYEEEEENKFDEEEEQEINKRYQQMKQQRLSEKYGINLQQTITESDQVKKQQKPLEQAGHINQAAHLQVNEPIKLEDIKQQVKFISNANKAAPQKLKPVKSLISNMKKKITKPQIGKNVVAAKIANQ